MAFKNFSIWRGRLPHWRADGVEYYATFRHRRSLDLDERQEVFRALLHWNGRRLDYRAVFVLPESSHLIFTVRAVGSRQVDFSQFLEKAKAKAGKRIVEKSGERWAPFYTECYDHILRDAEDMETHWAEILSEAENSEDADPDDATIWVLP